MISQSNISIGFDEGVKLLKDFELFKCKNVSRKMTFEKNKFSQEFINISQSDEYKNIYDTAMNKQDYDILLIDNSFFQFSYELNEKEFSRIRYAYYDVPYHADEYKEFLNSQGFLYEEVGEEFLEEYEQYISEAELKQQVLPIRYDYDTLAYKPKIHSSSHMHIGHNNEMRIPCDKIVLPQNFISFVIRHVYFEKYKAKMADDNIVNEYFNYIVNNKRNEYTLSEEEKQDIYLCL